MRAIARTSGLSIGVCWLLTSDDRGGDGRLRNYLSSPSRWGHYDPELYNALQPVALDSDVRPTVRHAERWGLIPGATYFDALLSDDATARDSYFSAAWKALRGSDLLFLDPDNGIEVQKPKRGGTGSAKYVYWVELREAYARGHSLLIYQHFPHVNHERFVPFLADRLAEELGTAHVTAFTTQFVAFFVVKQAAHVDALSRAAAEVAGCWGDQIKVWLPGSP